MLAATTHSSQHRGPAVSSVVVREIDGVAEASARQ